MYATPTRAALSVVQAATNFNASCGTSIAATISTTGGNLLVALVRHSVDSTTGWTVSDSASQSWSASPDGTFVLGAAGSAIAGINYMANSSAVTSVTATFGAGGMTNCVIIVYEISGAKTTGQPDSHGSVQSNQTAATSATSNTITTVCANTILMFGVAMNGGAGNETAGTGYTIATNGQDSSGRGGMEYKIVSSTQSGVTAGISWVNSFTYGDDLLAFADSGCSGAAAATPSRTMMGTGQ